MFGSRTSRIRRARLVPIALTTAALSSAVLGASVTGTLSAFNASITNDKNTATSGSLVMKESGPGANGPVSCLSSDGGSNSASCSTINKYGGATLTPGAPSNTPVTVTIANLGSSQATGFTLNPKTCDPTRASTNVAATTGNLCAALKLTVDCQGTSGSPVSILSGKYLNALDPSYDLKALSNGACVPGPNETQPVTFTFRLTMDSTADATVQNQQVSQNLVWTFTGA